MLNLTIHNDNILAFGRPLHVRLAFPGRHRRLPHVNKTLIPKAQPPIQPSHILIALHDRKLPIALKQIKLLEAGHSGICLGCEDTG